MSSRFVKQCQSLLLCPCYITLQCFLGGVVDLPCVGPGAIHPECREACCEILLAARKKVYICGRGPRLTRDGLRNDAQKQRKHLASCISGSEASRADASSSVIPSASSNSTTGSGSNVAKLRTITAPQDVHASCGDRSGTDDAHRQQL
jgi:hypothetical protein